jgi:hypothetical protein
MRSSSLREWNLTSGTTARLTRPRINADQSSIEVLQDDGTDIDRQPAQLCALKAHMQTEREQLEFERDLGLKL